MQRKANETQAYVARFDPQAQARPALILLYGHDSGAIRTYADQIERAFLGTAPDPLQKSFLTSTQLVETPALLADEAAAIPMFGGVKFINARVQGKDGQTAIIDYLDAPTAQSLVVVEATNLSKANPLLKAVEKSEIALALPCYEADADVQRDTIRAFLANEGFRIDAQALTHLQKLIGADRGVTQRELERLVLYFGPTQKDAQDGSQAPRTITLEDVLAVMDDTATSSFDALADAVALGEVATAERALARLTEAGTPASVALMLVKRHLQMLHHAVGITENPRAQQNTARAFKPPIHWKRRDAVQKQLQIWSRRRATAALAILQQAEADGRKTGAISDTLAAHALLRIARGAAVMTKK